MSKSTCRFPVWKLFLFLAVLLLGNATISIYDAVVHPTIAASVAVDQLDNTERGAITMRAYDQVQNLFPVGVWGATVLFGALLFRADFMRLITNLRNEL